MSTLQRKSIGREKAIELAETEWWKRPGVTPQQVFEFTMQTVELCCDFHAFHQAAEKALGRSVWTHEFAHLEGLWGEYLGERKAPTMQEIIDMIPEAKRILVVVDDGRQEPRS